MKHIVIAAAAAALITGSALAQTAVTTGGSSTTTTTTTTTIEPEVRTKVRQYITTNKPRAVTAPSGFTVSRGAVLPETVEIQSFPSSVGVTQYRYVTIGEDTVLVDSNRRIIEVLD